MSIFGFMLFFTFIIPAIPRTVITLLEIVQDVLKDLKRKKEAEDISQKQTLIVIMKKLKILDKNRRYHE